MLGSGPDTVGGVLWTAIGDTRRSTEVAQTSVCSFWGRPKLEDCHSESTSHILEPVTERRCRFRAQNEDLEDKFQRKLNLTGISSGQDSPCQRRISSRLRNPKLCVIEGIKELGAELESLGLSYLKALEQ